MTYGDWIQLGVLCLMLIGAVLGGMKWFATAIFRQEVQPVRDALLKVAEELRQTRETQTADRQDFHTAVEALTKIVQDQDKRLALLEARTPARRRAKAADA